MKQKERKRTPEEQLDMAVLESSGILPFFWFVMIISVGIELFGCLMPLEMNIKKYNSNYLCNSDCRPKYPDITPNNLYLAHHKLLLPDRKIF